MNEAEVKEMLDYLSGKYDNGTMEPPRTVGTAPTKDPGGVHEALGAVTTRSDDRTVILPTSVYSITWVYL